MTNDNDFFDLMEEIDTQLLTKFAKDTSLFTKLFRNEPFAPIDFEAVSKKGNRCSVELKTREKLYDPLFIEPSKYNNLMLEWQKNKKVPLYINFIGNEAFVFDLRNNPKPNETTLTIYNKGRERKEIVKRFELPIITAYRYYLDENDNKWKKC